MDDIDSLPLLNIDPSQEEIYILNKYFTCSNRNKYIKYILLLVIIALAVSPFMDSILTLCLKFFFVYVNNIVVIITKIIVIYIAILILFNY